METAVSTLEAARKNVSLMVTESVLTSSGCLRTRRARRFCGEQETKKRAAIKQPQNKEGLTGPVPFLFFIANIPNESYKGVTGITAVNNGFKGNGQAVHYRHA